MSRYILMAALAVFAASLFAAPAQAGKREKSERLVARSAETMSYFASDSAFETMWSLSDEAKAMVIIPRSLRGGFVFGASGGNATMVARNKDGSWSQPTFMTVGSVSFGFQAGGEASEIILLVMTNRGMEQLLSTSVKLGADLTLAAGPIGAGAKAQTTDILAFSRSRGLYGGVSLEGALLKTRHSWNEAYYNAEVTPADIIYRQQAYNPTSAVLQNAAYALAHRDDAPVFAPLQPVNGAQPALEGGQPGAAYPATPQAPVYGGAAQPAPQQGYPDGSGTYDDDEAWGAPVKQGPDQ